MHFILFRCTFLGMIFFVIVACTVVQATGEFTAENFFEKRRPPGELYFAKNFPLMNPSWTDRTNFSSCHSSVNQVRNFQVQVKSVLNEVHKQVDLPNLARTLETLKQAPKPTPRLRLPTSSTPGNDLALAKLKLAGLSPAILTQTQSGIQFAIDRLRDISSRDISELSPILDASGFKAPVCQTKTLPERSPNLELGSVTDEVLKSLLEWADTALKAKLLFDAVKQKRAIVTEMEKRRVQLASLAKSRATNLGNRSFFKDQKQMPLKSWLTAELIKPADADCKECAAVLTELTVKWESIKKNLAEAAASKCTVVAGAAATPCVKSEQLKTWITDLLQDLNN